MTSPTTAPTSESPLPAPHTYSVEDMIHKAVDGSRTHSDLVPGTIPDQQVFDDLFAQIDRNLELADQHLARA